MSESLNKLQKLYYTDQSIKKEMIEMSPPRTGLNKEGIIGYIDQVDKYLNYIFYQLKSLSNSFSFEDSFNEKIESLEQDVLKDLYKSEISIDKLREFYRKRISDMKQSLLDSIKKNYYGYNLRGDKEAPLKEVSSINEMLHLIHFRVINDDAFLKSCNLIESKLTNYDEPITTYGYPSKFLEDVFNSLGLDLDIGPTTIVGVSERLVLMMVRDVGHALTMELKQGDSITSVDYYIPKITQVDKVNKLPGVIPVKDRSIGTTGSFDFPNDEIYQLGSFIERVPQDTKISDVDNKSK